jgi:hypothetical protein
MFARLLILLYAIVSYAAPVFRSTTMRAVLCSAFTGPEDLRIGEIEACAVGGYGYAGQSFHDACLLVSVPAA